jgi:hypothetical protein
VAQSILALAHPAPKSTGLEIADTHPSLENDAAWSDGKKLNDPNPDLL